MADYSVSQPLSTFYGTHLSPVVSTYERMCDRVAMSLGYPMINLEVHRNQIYEFITMSVEYFTKFAGYDEEFLVIENSLSNRMPLPSSYKLVSKTRNSSS